ncbi:MAG: glycosyltransferase family 39 protein [Caldilineaceae bacterium]
MSMAILRRGVLLSLLLLAWGLRLWRLDYQELRGDEVFGYFFSLRPITEIVPATLALQEPHPVASYYLQHGWLAWAGHSEFALRFSSLWMGVLAVALLYRLALALQLPPPTALLATCLLTLSPYAIWHSQDARMYSMSLALTIASTWLMLEWLQHRRLVWALGYLLVSWLALHTHYFSVFVLAAQNLFLLGWAVVEPRLRTPYWAWLGWQAALALLYAPWLWRAQAILTRYSGNGDSPGLGAMLWRAGSVLAVGESTPPGQRLAWAGLAALLLLLGAMRLARGGPEQRRALALLLCYLAIPLLATWWSATQRPIFNERYLVAALPPFLLLLASALPRAASAVSIPHVPIHTVGAVSIPHVRGDIKHVRYGNRTYVVYAASVYLVALLLVTGLMLGLYRHYTDPAYSKTRGWRELAQRLSQLSAQLPADQVRIAQNFPDPTLWYYYRGPVDHVVLPPAPHAAADAQKLVAELADAGTQRILLPLQPASNWDESQIAPRTLATAFTLVAEPQVGVWPLQIYVAPPVVVTPLQVAFQNGVHLTGFALQPEQLTPGNLLTVQLAWQVEGAQLTGAEKIFVQLLDHAGALVAQDDRPLVVDPAARTQPTWGIYGILLPETLAAGDYQLIAGLYDPGIEAMPRILTDDGSDHVVLATVRR